MPVGLLERGAVRQLQPRRVTLRNRQCFGAPINPHPGCTRQFRQRRQQQRPRTSPAIEHALRGGPLGQRDFDQHLAIPARDQHGRGDIEMQPEKLLMPANIGDRFMRRAARDQPGKGGRNRIGHPPQEQIGPADPQRLSHQQFRIAARGIGARTQCAWSEQQRGGADRFGHGLGVGQIHSPSAASRLA